MISILEITVQELIDEAGKENELTSLELIQELEQKLGYKPNYFEVEKYLKLDPRRHKPWPKEEDCSGCDQPKTGPHRFSCYVQGKNQVILPAIQTEDGKFIVNVPEKK